MQLFFPVTLLTKTGKLASIAKYIDGLKASKLATEISKISKKYKKIADKLEKRLSTSNIQAFLDLLKFMSEKMRLGTKGFVNWLEEIFEGLKKWLDDLFGPNSKEFAIYNKKLQKMWDEFKYADLIKTPPKKKPCFLAGTFVKTKSGLKAIETILVGEKVYSYNLKNKNVEISLISEIFQNFTEKYVVIETEKGHIEATGQHKFWLEQEQKWVSATELKVGSFLFTHDQQHTKIKSLKIINETAPTYNLEVEKNHNYYVGKEEILAHNDGAKKFKFSDTTKHDFGFYRLVESKGDTIKNLYVGITTQEFAKRADQHVQEGKAALKGKKPHNAWKAKGDLLRIEEFTSMTFYEASVWETYFINERGGGKKHKGLGKLHNRKVPISENMFDTWKKHGGNNPCKYFV